MDNSNALPSTTGRKKRTYAPHAYEFGTNSQAGLDGSGQMGISPMIGSRLGLSPDPLVNQFSQMSVGSVPAHSQQTQKPQPQSANFQTTATLPPRGAENFNKLYSTDLIQQPFNVQELDDPPPPIHLPLNASVTSSPFANCSSQYIRSTLNTVPINNSLLKKSRLPFALVIQPYISLHDAEAPVPLIADQVISRCRRCRSYIHPFVTFVDQGHRWKCNMCNLTNDVPQSFDWDAANQKPVDRLQRPELNSAVVEFVAPQEYMVRAPQPLVYLFLLDVTNTAVAMGLLATTARCILESLDRIPNADRRTKLGFIAVDSSLHYISIPRDENENGESKILVVSDLDEPFLPIPEDLVVNLTECRQNIERFLEKLQSMFEDSQSSSSAMGSGLRAGYRLISNTGGKIVVLSSSLPNCGYGKLTVREDKKLLGTSKEGNLLQPANNFYKPFAVDCSKVQVSIDLFLFSSQYQDVATLSNLPRYTGGQTFFYPGWNAARPEDAIKFAREFSDYLSTEIGLEAVLRVRATTGLRMSNFYGNFFNRSSDLCAFPAFPRDQAYVVEVAFDDPISKPSICMQAAVLHTTSNGERRIRVLTLTLPTTDSLSPIYASADQEAIIAFYSHKAVEKALSGNLDGAREALQSKAIEILQTYKKELAGGNLGGGGVQLPSNLRALPVLFLSLIKHLGLRKSTQIPSDLRAAALCMLSTLPIRMMIQYIYPRMYSLHDMPDLAGTPDPSTGQIILPVPINLTSERIVNYGMYLIDDGLNQFLWLGSQIVPALVADVFGLSEKMQIKQGKSELPILDNGFNERVRAVIEASRDPRSKEVGSIIVPSLFVVREDGEPGLKLWAQTMLVEDRGEQNMSLTQWIGLLREKVVV